MIVALGNTNILSEAKKAVSVTDKQQVEQLANLAWADAYLGGATTETELKQEVVKALEANGITEDDYLVITSTSGVRLIDLNSWDHAYTCTNGIWSERIKSGSPADGDIVARFYKTGNKITLAEEAIQLALENGVTVAEEQDEYQLVITGAGTVGEVEILNEETEEWTFVAWRNIHLEEPVQSVYFSTTELILAAELERQELLICELFWGLKNIIIVDGVSTIGDNVFTNCTSLTNIVIPSSVTSIGDYAFHECEALEDIKIPSSVTNIGSGAFACCRSLTTITIPGSVTNIKSNTFLNCDSLSSVILLNGVTNIEGWVFSGGLRQITLPSSLRSIGVRSFEPCDNLTTVNYTGSEDEWNEIIINEYNEPLTSATKIYNYVIK